ncbi:hypothetical protein D3C85_1359730 [compost metagenome]
MNTIIEKEIETKSILLNSEQTVNFLQRINSAIHSFDFVEIFKVVLDFKLTNAPDIDDFLEQARAMTKVSDKYETIVKSVTTFKTKCIACSFGKTVNGYEIQSAVKDSENLRFNNKTAIYFDITGGELFEFGWCNAFLSRAEVSELNKH